METRRTEEPPRAAWSWEAPLVRRLLGFVLLLAIAAASAIALSPGLFAQRIPYDEADLGNVAAATIKATRDYDIPDDETTRRMREEAVGAVRAVYEHDAAAVEGALARVRDGFAHARSMLPPEEAPEPRGKAPAPPPSLSPVARAAIEQTLGARLEDGEFDALVAARFAPPVEEAVSSLVASMMREMVVGDREELAQHRERGIAIRRVGGEKAVEDILSDVGGIRDLTRVREQVDVEAVGLTTFPGTLRQAVGNLARREIRSNLKYDPDLTRKRREDAAAGVKPVVIQLKKGEKVIGDGERIDARHLLIFRGMRARSQTSDLLQVRFGGGLFAALLVLVLLALSKKRLPVKDAVLLTGSLVAMLFFANLWLAVADVLRERTPEIPFEAWTYAIPFAAAPMLLRFVLRSETALLFAVALASLAGVLSGSSLFFALFVLVGCLTGAARVAGARDRAGLFRAGAVAGLVQAAAVVCFALFAGRIASWDVPISAVAALVGGAILAPALVMALLPLVEGGLGYVSDMRLLELANLNHPALKELIVQAPGTYHHSIIVGTLVEGAAESIGANPLLAKVCAYYHDLGKGRNPLFFGENQKGSNRHDELPPEESARVIIEHVGRGLELARKHRLPAQVVAAIPEHHGTRLVGYFYHKALKAGGPVDADRFRYAGPRPQSRETALIMMADAVEAASRAMPDPTAEKLEALVGKLIGGIQADGQLDECELTLRDLAAIRSSFCRTLGGIYHARPDYPAAAKGPQSEMLAKVSGAA